MVFPKKFHLYDQKRWYFFFPKISFYSLDGKWKMILLKTISSNVLKKWFFQKNCTGIWSFLLYYLERWYFFFPKIWSYSLDGKWKMIFLKKKKNTWKYDIFFKCSEKFVFPKKNCSWIWSFSYYLERWFFFLENMIFFLSMENEGLSFSRNTWNYDICINDTNLLFSQKNTLKGDWHSRSHSRKSSNDSLYFYGDLHRRFHILLSSEKKPGNLINRIEIWLLLQFIWLEIFYNEESSILCTIQPSGVVFRGVLERQLRKLFVH